VTIHEVSRARSAPRQAFDPVIGVVWIKSLIGSSRRHIYM
jgi:hypothetical protein